MMIFDNNLVLKIIIFIIIFVIIYRKLYISRLMKMSRKHVCTDHAMPTAFHQRLKVDRRGIKEGRLIDTFKYIWVAP